MLTDEELDAVIRTEPAAVYELRSSDATPAAVRESLRLIARMIEREAYRRAAAECRAVAVDFRRTGNQCTDGRYTWKADGAEDCAEAIEALGREE